MTNEQRARALRLATTLDYLNGDEGWRDIKDASGLLRELATEQPHCSTCRYVARKVSEYPCKWCTAEDNFPKWEADTPQAESDYGDHTAME